MFVLLCYAFSLHINLIYLDPCNNIEECYRQIDHLNLKSNLTMKCIQIPEIDKINVKNCYTVQNSTRKENNSRKEYPFAIEIQNFFNTPGDSSLTVNGCSRQGDDNVPRVDQVRPSAPSRAKKAGGGLYLPIRSLEDEATGLSVGGPLGMVSFNFPQKSLEEEKRIGASLLT